MRFCAMIPNPVERETFPAEFVRQHEGILRDALLDRSLIAGFEALRLIRAREIAQQELEERKQRRKDQQVKSAPSSDNKPPAEPVAPEESAANN